MTNETVGTPVKYDMDEVATVIGYRMIGVIGAMNRLGLSTLPHFVRTYIDPSRTDDPTTRDFERWLRWALSPSKSAERDHMHPDDLAYACQRFLVRGHED